MNKYNRKWVNVSATQQPSVFYFWIAAAAAAAFNAINFELFQFFESFQQKNKKKYYIIISHEISVLCRPCLRAYT